jgi:hypothetical protein
MVRRVQYTVHLDQRKSTQVVFRVVIFVQTKVRSMSALVRKVELETGATTAGLLEKLSEWMAPRLKATGERMTALLSHRIIWILAIVEPLAQF